MVKLWLIKSSRLFRLNPYLISLNSGWPIAAVLEFALGRLAPTPNEHSDAVNAIEDLWYDDAIIIGAGIYHPDPPTPTPTPSKKKKKTKSSSSMPATSSNKANTPKANKANTTKISESSEGGTESTTPADSLVIYFNPDVGLKKPRALANWISLLRIYHEISPTENPSPADMPKQIVLRSIPARPVVLPGGLPSISAPLIRTRSALGILRAGTGAPDYFIGFISPDQYANVVSCRGRTDDYSERMYVDYYYEVNSDENKYISGCGHHRKYILVLCSDTPPKEAYVQDFDERHKVYNYISIDDRVSQNNFTLLSLFMIIQAAPGPPPLVPTIAVGGR